MPDRKPLSQNLCLYCTTKRKSCCSNDYYISLTTKDVKNLKKLGYQLKDVAIPCRFTEKQLAHCAGLKDTTILLNKKYYAIALKKNKKGDCIFLVKGKGCLLGHNRPLECKLYPFWLNKKNQLVYQDSYCYLARAKTPIKEATKVMGESEKEVRSYFKQIKNDYKKNKKQQIKMLSDLLK